MAKANCMLLPGYLASLCQSLSRCVFSLSVLRNAAAGNIMVCIEPPAQPLLAAAYKALSLLGKQNSTAAQELLRPRIVLLDVGKF